MTTFLASDRRSQQLRKLTEVSRAFTYAVSVEQVLDIAVKRAAELFDAEKAVLMLSNENDVLLVRAAQGLDKAACDAFREPRDDNWPNRLNELLGDGANERFLSVPLVVGGAVIGLVAVALLHSEVEEAENEWLLSALADQAAVAIEKTRLDQTAEFRERLIGIVSHDLRNPIATVLLGANLLLDSTELDPNATRITLRIRSSAERAVRMIRDLLDFTQARLGGGILVERKPTNLHQVVRQVVDEHEIAHPERRIRVAFSGNGTGNWDGDRMAQVVGNLLSNALTYSPSGSEVQIDLRDDGAGLILQVHNMGAAIPATRLSEIFEPMKRATADLNAYTRSIGLGLYIVKHVVEAHGGRVSVRSVEGEGTTFTLHLPRS